MEGAFVGWSVGVITGIRVMGGKGGVGRLVGCVELGTSETIDGSLVGAPTSGERLVVGKGASEGAFVGFPVCGIAELGLGPEGEGVGMSVGGPLLGGNGVGIDVGFDVMLPSKS